MRPLKEEVDGRGRVLRLFAYGSLKTGECNYNQVQPYFLESRPAAAPGQMLLRPDGYPALVVDPELILAMGSDDRAGDLRETQNQTQTQNQNQSQTQAQAAALVPGQLLHLHTGVEITEKLDVFEGYFPGRPSEYLRVLIPIRCDAAWETAWVYVAAHPDPTWPPIETWPHDTIQPPPYRYQLPEAPANG